MTQVFFYHNAPDRLSAVAALIGKAALQKTLLVYAPDREIADALDRQLWVQQPTGFIPHVRGTSPLAAETPVVITDKLETETQNERLFNLSAEVPPGFSRFTSVIEVIGQDETDRQSGQERAKFYKDRGYEIKFIDPAGETLMADTGDVLDRTNALIQRRRSFVATRPTPPPAPPTPTTSSAHLPNADDDLPVLTEVVSPEAAVSASKIERLNETQIMLLAAEIAHAFGEQLAAKLPALLETALTQTSKNLRTGISTIMEDALRDFLVRRQTQAPREQSQTAVDGTPPPG